VDPVGLALVTERQWKNPGDLLKSYTNLEKLTGVPADKIIKLPTDANPESWNQVYDKLGRPATAEGYKLPVPEGDTGEFAKEAGKWFHELGMSQNQAVKLAEKWNGHMAGLIKADSLKTEETHTADVAALKTEWGKEYQSRCTIVDNCAKAFGMSEAHILALKAAMGPKAAMNFLHNLGSKVAVEDKGLIGGGGNRDFNALSPESAALEITRLKNNRDFVEMFNSHDPKTRAESREKMQRLHAIAYPE
jgi:hypothetical protein